MKINDLTEEQLKIIAVHYPHWLVRYDSKSVRKYNSEWINKYCPNIPDEVPPHVIGVIRHTL